MKIGAFKIPNKATITARTSSLTNSFIASIMPYVKPSLEDFAKALKILQMEENGLTCVYCGGKHTEWDHLRPFVEKKRPTGYYTTMFNLVPACGKCNQSKGNSDWETWINDAHHDLHDLKKRIGILKKYEKAGNLRPVSPEDILGKEVFKKYMTLCDEIIVKMKEAHEVSCRLRGEILEKTGVSKKLFR